MKEELNNYNITNSEGGAKQTFANEGKVSFANDDPHCYQESLRSEEGETFRVSESFDAPKENRVESTSFSEKEAASSSSDPSSLSSAASSATSSVASAASSIGSSIGAMAGMVASAVATVAIVVAVFVSTLVINLSLAMADMHSLTFEIEMQGAQEEDFENPIWAILTGEDGVYLEQPVTQDTVMLTFEGLNPGKEYLIRIKNSEKVFVKKTYFTATKPIDKGSIVLTRENNEYCLTVKGAKLSKGEYYTLLVKDAQGKTVFSKDDVKTDAEYRFTLSEPKSLFTSFTVNGKTFALCENLYTPEDAPSPAPSHKHDYGTLIAATLAQCETEGMMAHYYCEGCGKFFDEDKKEVSEESLVIAKLGHDYGSHVETIYPTCDEDGMEGHFQCGRCLKYFNSSGETTKEALTIKATGHEYVWFPGIASTCTETGMDDHYQCSKCQKYFNILKREISEESLILSARGHNLSALNPEDPAECEKEGKAAYSSCYNCGALFDKNNNLVEKAEDLVIPALGHDFGTLIPRTSATSVTQANGVLPHYHCSRCSRDYDESKTKVLGNDVYYRLTYENPTWEWFYNEDGVPVSATATFVEVHGDLSRQCEVMTGDHLVNRVVYPTCETSGYWFCTANVELYVNEEYAGSYDTYEADYSEHYDVMPPLGHDLELQAGTLTCETSGTVDHFKCSRCNKLFDLEENEVLYEEELLSAPTGHSIDLFIHEQPSDCEQEGLSAHYECSKCHELFIFENDEYVKTTKAELTIPALADMLVLNSSVISSSTTYGQEYVGRKVIFMTADRSAAVSFDEPNHTSTDTHNHTKFTILYVNSYPSIVLTYSDGEETYYLNTTELGGIVNYNLLERDGSYDQIKFKTGTNKLYVSKDLVDYYFVYDDESESIVLTSNVSEISEDKYVYMYVLPTHDYGELIAENADDNGLLAHYKCSLCGKYFDSDKNETSLGALHIQPNLSLSSDRIVIYADGYKQGVGDFIPNESAMDKPYLISGGMTGDTPLTIRTDEYSGARKEKVTFYLEFTDANILGSAWCSALVVHPYCDVDIFITNNGITTISGYNHPAFSIQGNPVPGYSVNIYVTSNNGFETFKCGRQDGSSTDTLYNTTYKYNDVVYPVNVTFRMNGQQVNSDASKKSDVQEPHAINAELFRSVPLYIVNGGYNVNEVAPYYFDNDADYPYVFSGNVTGDIRFNCDYNIDGTRHEGDSDYYAILDGGNFSISAGSPIIIQTVYGYNINVHLTVTKPITLSSSNNNYAIGIVINNGAQANLYITVNDPNDLQFTTEMLYEVTRIDSTPASNVNVYINGVPINPDGSIPISSDEPV